MHDAHSQAGFTNVVYHLRGFPQRLVALGAEARVHRWGLTAALKRARKDLCRPYGTRSASTLAPGTYVLGYPIPPLRGWKLFASFDHVVQSPVFTHARKRRDTQDQPRADLFSAFFGCATAFFSLVLFSASFVPPSLQAEEMPRIGTGIPPLPTQPRPVMQSAGFAFAGTVEAVEHIAPAGRNRIGTTRITFHVDTPIRGVRAGQTLVVTEWAGLWASGERYRAGERVCLLLYPPSKLGLTSPVRGPAGRFRVRGPGRIVVPPRQRGILPLPVRTRLDENGEIRVEDFARALQERSEP